MIFTHTHKKNQRKLLTNFKDIIEWIVFYGGMMMMLLFRLFRCYQFGFRYRCYSYDFLHLFFLFEIKWILLNFTILTIAGILRYKVDFQSMQLEDGLYDDDDFDLDDYWRDTTIRYENKRNKTKINYNNWATRSFQIASRNSILTKHTNWFHYK